MQLVGIQIYNSDIARIKNQRNEMVYTLRFFSSSKCSLFHNSNFFGSCIIHTLYTGVLNLKKNNPGSKRLRARVIFLFDRGSVLQNICELATQVRVRQSASKTDKCCEVCGNF